MWTSLLPGRVFYLKDNVIIVVCFQRRFLEVDYSQYCPPGDVLTGYSNLPLSHVYKNGTKIRTTTKRLPSGELIDGKKSYRTILDYFTTIDISPENINGIGYSLIKESYPKVQH